jgi:hypothetical protein
MIAESSATKQSIRIQLVIVLSFHHVIARSVEDGEVGRRGNLVANAYSPNARPKRLPS